MALAAAVLTAGVRLWTLGHQNLWLDELTTAWVIGLDAASLVHDRLAAAHSPLYFLLLKGFGLGGASDFLLRLPSVAFDAAAAVVLALTARRIAGNTAALAMGFLYAFTPILVQYGQEARPFALENLFLALGLAAVVTLTRAPRLATAAFGARRAPAGAKAAMRGAAALLVVAAAGAGWTLPTGWIAVALLQGSILVQPALLRDRGFLRLWLLLAAFTWLLLLPIIVLLAPALAGDLGTAWTGENLPLAPWNVVATLGLVFGSVIPGDPDRFLGGPFAIVGPALVVATAITAAVARRRRPQVRRATWLALGTAAALFVLSIAQGLIAARYFLPALLPFLLLAAVGAAIWWRLPGTSIVLLAVGVAVALQGLDAANATNKTDWKPIIRLMTASRKPVAVAVSRGELAVMLRRYMPPETPLTTEIVPDGGPMTAAVLPTLLHGDTAWALSDKARPDFTGLPPGMVGCSWQQEDYWVVAVAPNRRALPEGIQDCAPENGPLLVPTGG